MLKLLVVLLNRISNCIYQLSLKSVDLEYKVAHTEINRLTKKCQKKREQIMYLERAKKNLIDEYGDKKKNENY